MAKIQYILDITYSRFDSFGNRYSIVAITQTETGRTAEFYASSNVFPESQIVKWLGGEMSNYYITERTVPIREFNREFNRMKAKGIPEMKEETLLKEIFSLPL